MVREGRIITFENRAEIAKLLATVTDDSVRVERKKLIRAIKKSIRDDQNGHFVDYILEEIVPGDMPVYLIGGRVRDAIRERIHGVEGIVHNDIDLWIDDRGFEQLDLEHIFDCDETGVIVKNRYGNLKWSPYTTGLEIDIGRLSGANLARAGLTDDYSIASALIGSDLTSGSIAFELRGGTLFDFGCLEAMKAKEVGINFLEERGLTISVVRLVLHANRFGYRIDVPTCRLIQNRLLEVDDNQMAAYLAYKGYGPETAEMVTDTLINIAIQPESSSVCFPLQGNEYRLTAK
jgi:hypothetical protein